MALKLKTGPKIGLVVIAFVGLYFGLKAASTQSWFPSTIGKILTPSKANLMPVEDAQVANVTALPYPSTSPANVPNTLIRGEIWEWNAQAGLLYATGGPTTTKGSLMEKNKVNLMLTRQDDTGKMGEDLLKCAQEIKAGEIQCDTGANFVVIMGDGAAQFAAGLNPQLKKLGPDYGLKVIGATGYSRGEDSFMAPASLKASPSSIATTVQDGTDTTGLLVEGVIRDGDWNIAMKWAGDNNIPNNPDEKTYDAHAMNWVNAPDYITAATDYVSGSKCEDRKEVSGGHPTGKTVHVCVNGVVTWTPGDVIVATQRGGLVKVVSSKEYRSQMPAVIIGPAHFFKMNSDEITGMLAATFSGGDQVKAFDGALQAASKIAATVYDDQGGKDENGVLYADGRYWYRFFKPQTLRDKSKTLISLGGSAVCNLADNKILFGLQLGQNDNFRSTYNVFAAIDKQQYPDMFKDPGPTPLPPVNDIESKDFVLSAEQLMLNPPDSSTQGSSGAVADTVDYSTAGTGEVISKGKKYIPFATGSAIPLPIGEQQLAILKDELAITGLKIQIDGYTDNTGSASVNTQLSQARAMEVKTWLQQHAGSSFPNDRFASVQGHGPDNPVSDNSTVAGKAANRRVEITLIN